MSTERMQCGLVQRYPFNTQAIFLLGERKPPESHPLSRFIEFLEAYEREILFKKLDQTTRDLRSALEYETQLSWMTSGNLEQLKATGYVLHRVGEDIYAKLCSLLTAYRLVDVFASNPVAGEVSCPPNQVRPNVFREDMVKNRQWDKLRNWPKILREARIGVEKMKSLSNNRYNIAGHNHIRHLFDVAKRVQIGKFMHLADNFQIAAMYLSYMLKMPVDDGSCNLPDIPDDLHQLLNLNLPTQSTDTFVAKGFCLNAEESSVTEFLKETSASKLRMPLQLALIISPLFLLMTVPLTNTKWKFQSILAVSESLGNDRPTALRDLESEILACLFRIAARPDDLLVCLESLVTNELWQQLEQLPHSDPAFMFFHGSQLTVQAHLEPASGTANSSTPLVPIYPPPISISVPQIYRFSLPISITPLPATEASLSQWSRRITDTVERRGPTQCMGIDESLPILQTEGFGRIDYVEKGPNRERIPSISNSPQVSGRTGVDGSLPRGVEETNHEKNNNTEVDTEVEEENINFLRVGGTTGESVHVGEEQPLSSIDIDAEGELSEGCDAKEGDTITQTSPTTQRDSDEETEDEEVDATDPAPKLHVNAKGKGNKRKRPTVKQKPKKKVQVESESEEEEIIDLDLFEPKRITLDVKTQPAKFIGPEITAYGPTGEVRKFRPKDIRNIEMLIGLRDGIESAYENGLPLHISNPEKSVFRVLPESDLESKTDAAVQGFMRTQHVILTDVRGSGKVRTFGQGLRTLGAVTAVTTIQDLSIPVRKNYNKRKKQGRLSQLLEASLMENGKSLNALDIPMRMAGFQSTPFSSDVHALEATMGDWKTTKPLSVGDFRWALAATAGAFHTWHIDSDGLATFIEVTFGIKWWIVARPRDRTKDFRQFANIRIFTDGRFDIDRTCLDLWILEAILLEPGTRLYMRPNTPHAVFTPSHSVVHGGHMYSTSTLQESYAGIVHCLMASSWITNTNHTVARFHLQQMIAFFHLAIVEKEIGEEDPHWDHVPKCSTKEGFHDLMAICLLGVLINVLDFNTYIHPEQLGDTISKAQKNEMLCCDINNLDPEERRACTFTRGQSLQIMDHVAKSFTLVFPEDEPSPFQSTEAYQHNIILEQCWTIYQYKLLAQDHEIEGAAGSTLEMVRTQLCGALPEKHPVAKRITATLWNAPGTAVSLRIDEHPMASLKKVEPRGFTIRDPMTLGMSQRDCLYQSTYGSKTIKMQSV